MRPTVRTARRSLLLALLTCSAIAVAATQASAIVVQLKSGARLSYQPTAQRAHHLHTFSEPKAPLEYHGGPVMPESTVYAIFWDPTGVSPYATGFTAGVEEYFTDVAHDSGHHANVQSVSEQYTDSKGEHATYKVTFGGAIIDTDKLPKGKCKAASICLDGAQLEKEVKKVVDKHKLPQDLKHEYFLFSGPNMENCFEKNGFECSAGTISPAYCAYHSVLNGKSGPIVWANLPYVYEKLCDEAGRHPRESSADSALLGGLSHEWNESLTDPELNAWFGGEGEIGDVCRTFEEASEFGPVLGFAPDGSPYNQVINGHLYDYQQEWSNSGDECKQHLP